jgi:hypothetical protein
MAYAKNFDLLFPKYSKVYFILNGNQNSDDAINYLYTSDFIIIEHVTNLTVIIVIEYASKHYNLIAVGWYQDCLT